LVGRAALDGVHAAAETGTLERRELRRPHQALFARVRPIGRVGADEERLLPLRVGAMQAHHDEAELALPGVRGQAVEHDIADDRARSPPHPRWNARAGRRGADRAERPDPQCGARGPAQQRASIEHAERSRII
jgi:hypothetical protein